MGIWIGSRTRPRVPLGPCGTAYLAGQAGSFSSGNYLERATEIGISPNPAMLVAGWVYLPSPTTTQVIVSKGDFSTNNYEWVIYIHSAFGFFGYWKTTSNFSIIAGNAPSANTWTHIGLEIESNIGRFYVNGTAVNTNTSQTGNFSQQNTKPLRFGASADNSSPLTNGSRLDAWGLWSGASLTSIAASVYNSGAGKAYKDLSGAELTSLVAFYNLDEIAGSATWCDWSGNGYHLTNQTAVTTAAGKV